MLILLNVFKGFLLDVEPCGVIQGTACVEVGNAGGPVPAGAGGMACAQAYVLGNAPDKAVPYYEVCINLPTPLPAAFMELTDLHLKAQRQSEATATVAKGLDALKDAASLDALATRLAACLQMGPVRDDIVFKALSGVALSPKSFQCLLIELAGRRLQQGNAQEALIYAKMAYDVAPVEMLTAPIDAVSRCLKTKDMEMTRVVQFVDFQRHGPVGPDGKAGTADDLKDPLVDAGRALPPEFVKAVQQRLSEMMPAKGRIYESLRDRGTLQLALGQYKEALRSCQAAYSVANIAQVKEASALAPRVLKAMDGNLSRANRYLDYVRCGPAGPDGKPGTTDDLANPLAGEAMDSLGADLEKALRELAETQGTALDACECRGQACLALGDHAKGIAHMKTGYAFAGLDEKSLSRAVEDMAAAIKAYDGHIVRANQYLVYQSKGAAGPDGKPGTDDDVTNPLPAILQEVEKGTAAK